MNCRCYQITLRVKNIRHKSGAVGSVAWGAGRKVRGRIRDNGQNILRSSFRTGGSRGPIHFQIFLLIAFLEEDISEIIIMGYLIIFMECSKILFFLLIIPMGTRKNFFENRRTFGQRPSKIYSRLLPLGFRDSPKSSSRC